VASFTYTYNAETELVSFANGSTIASGTISSYNWNFGDGNTSTETNPSYTFTSPGIFTVVLTATSAQGCSAVFDVQVNASVGVNEVAQSNSLQVYPNPVRETLNVVSTTGGVVYITDLSGRVVRANEKLNAGFITTLDVSTLAEGVYQVIMQGEVSFQSMRIVKIN
jgi:PKD repeat protein